MNLFEYLIIADESLVVPGPPEIIKRTWKERLFSMPWKPLKKTKTVATWLPSPKVIMSEASRTITAHTVVAKEMIEQIQKTDMELWKQPT